MPKYKTDKEFKQEVYDLVGSEYTFLENYVNSTKKLKVRHNECNNTYDVRPNKFLSGRRCPYCFGNHKKTDKEFQQEVYDLVGDEYTFLESYVNSKAKIKVRHEECGNIYEVRPNDFLTGCRCPYCFGKTKKTDDEFKQEVYELVGNEYTFLDPYVNTITKLRVKHDKCGNVYEVSPSNFLRGTRCPYCFGGIKETDDEFRKEVYGLVGNEYTFLDTYINTITKLRVKHNKCNSVYLVAPRAFIQGNRCPYCFGNAKKTDDEFKQEVYNLVGNDYLFLDSYVNANNKIRVKHNKCKNIYEVSPSNFLRGSRCPYCNSPKGEIIILKILDNLNINYDYQKTFDDLKDKDYLSYDFYIPSQSILIEYQGIQHYQPIDHFGGDDRFTIQQKHDQIKLDYAKEHGYNLIAVPYTVDTLPKIKKYLIKHGLK